jgi:hypothetical protein
MIFRQLFDGQTSTFSYLLADTRTRQALIIDSVFERHWRDFALMRGGLLERRVLGLPGEPNG